MIRGKFACSVTTGMAWHGVSAGIYWHFLGLAGSILVFWQLQGCVLLSGLGCMALWAARVVSHCFSVAYACAFTYAHSFTLLSVRGVFVNHVFFVFQSPPSSPYSFLISFSTEVLFCVTGV